MGLAALFFFPDIDFFLGFATVFFPGHCFSHLTTKTPPRQATSKIIWAKLRVRTLWGRGDSQTTADSESLGRGTPLELLDRQRAIFEGGVR